MESSQNVSNRLEYVQSCKKKFQAGDRLQKNCEIVISMLKVENGIFVNEERQSKDEYILSLQVRVLSTSADEKCQKTATT